MSWSIPRPQVLLRVQKFIDRRSPELRQRGAAIEQAARDLAIEQEWRRRVQANVARRTPAQEGAHVVR